MCYFSTRCRDWYEESGSGCLLTQVPVLPLDQAQHRFFIIRRSLPFSIAAVGAYSKSHSGSPVYHCAWDVALSPGILFSNLAAHWKHLWTFVNYLYPGPSFLFCLSLCAFVTTCQLEGNNPKNYHVWTFYKPWTVPCNPGNTSNREPRCLKWAYSFSFQNYFSSCGSIFFV